MKQSRKQSLSNWFGGVVVLALALLTTTFSACGSDSDAEAATALDKKITRQWHCKGFGLPSHIKEMVIDLSNKGKMKVYVKYVDQIQKQFGLEDVWYEGCEFGYIMQMGYEEKTGDFVYIKLNENELVERFKSVTMKQMIWFHYDFSNKYWMESPFEASDMTLNAKQLPFENVLREMIGQWMVDDGMSSLFVHYYPCYGDYLVINEAPFLIDNKGKFLYSGEPHPLGAQEVKYGQALLTLINNPTAMRKFELIDLQHANLYTVENGNESFLHHLVKLDYAVQPERQ